MKNIKAEVKGDILHLQINLKEEGEASASGKSLVIASTKGNVDLKAAPGVKLGINCYRPTSKSL